MLKLQISAITNICKPIFVFFGRIGLKEMLSPENKIETKICRAAPKLLSDAFHFDHNLSESALL
jgi:hypothetical protein